MTSFLAWLKKWWKWVVAGIAVVLAFITGFVVRKPKVVTPTPPEKRDAEQEARDKQAQLEKEAAEEAARIAAAAAKAREGQTTTVVDTTAEIKDDPQKVNDYLHKVGEDIRKP